MPRFRRRRSRGVYIYPAGIAVRRRRRFMPRVRRSRGRRGGRRMGFLGEILTGAIVALGGILVAHYIPQLRNVAIPAGLAIGGAAAYAFDGKAVGTGMLGAAAGLAAAPYVVGAVSGVEATKPSYTLVWGA